MIKNLIKKTPDWLMAVIMSLIGTSALAFCMHLGHKAIREHNNTLEVLSIVLYLIGWVLFIIMFHKVYRIRNPKTDKLMYKIKGRPKD